MGSVVCSGGTILTHRRVGREGPNGQWMHVFGALDYRGLALAPLCQSHTTTQLSTGLVLHVRMLRAWGWIEGSVMLTIDPSPLGNKREVGTPVLRWILDPPGHRAASLEGG